VILLLSENGVQIYVLEPSNLEELKKGLPVRSPIGNMLIAYSNDIAWTMNELTDRSRKNAEHGTQRTRNRCSSRPRTGADAWWEKRIWIHATDFFIRWTGDHLPIEREPQRHDQDDAGDDHEASQRRARDFSGSKLK